MALEKSDYLICPDCGKKGVTLRFKPAEDVWGCRYCEWYAFAGGNDRPDVRERTRLADRNPEKRGRLVWEDEDDD